MPQPTRQAPIKGTNLLVIATQPTSATVAGTAEHTYNRFENETPSGFHTTGNFMLSFTNKEDQQSLDDHLNSFLLKNPVSEIEITYSNGISATYKDSADDTKTFGFIYYGGEVNNQICVHYGLGVYTGDTGSRAYAANTLGGTTIEVTAVESSVTVTFPSTLLSSGLVTYTADLTLGAGVSSTYTYLTIA